MDWQESIESYTQWLTASGASPMTIRLRRHYLRHLSMRSATPWGATVDDLIGLIATPGWAPETRKSARSSVRAFYGWAMDTDRIVVDPSRSLPRVRVPLGLPKPTPQPVVAAALARADTRGRMMILLASMAGLRRSEIATVHSDDITPDLTGLSLRVCGKGGRVRSIPMHPQLAIAVCDRPVGYLFPGKIDGHLSPDRVGHILRKLLGPGWSGHSLRHRFSTEAYAVERDLFAVQRLLGHSKPETTARYVQVPDDSLRTAVLGLATWAA